MEITEKYILEDLKEDNALLSSKIDVYKEEIKTLKEKLEYTKKLFVLYENIMECSKSEVEELTATIKELENENARLQKNNSL